MPDGEACNADGTLKDAAEMIWLHSPGSKSSPTISFSKRAHSDIDEDEVTSNKKTRVSIKSKTEKWMRLTVISCRKMAIANSMIKMHI